jgi:hypothetical protein
VVIKVNEVAIPELLRPIGKMFGNNVGMHVNLEHGLFGLVSAKLIDFLDFFQVNHIYCVDFPIFYFG